MALSDQQRSSLEELPSLVAPLLTLANVANPAIATVTYAYGVMMRVLQLGSAVRAAVAKEKSRLDATVRAAGLFRVPVEVSFIESDVRNFVSLGRSSYPLAFQQLEDDIRVLGDSGHADAKGARERLAIARTVIPRVYRHYVDTGELSHPAFPLMSLDYVQLLNPGEPKPFRALISNLHIERTTLFEGGLSSANLLGERLPAYVQAQLRVERQNLDATQQQALDRTVDSVRDLYWSFVFGDGEQTGVAQEAVDFLVERALRRIEEERSELASERERLTALPEDQRDDDRLQDITERVEELSDLEGRLRGRDE